MRRIISAILCMIFLIQIVTVSVCAQSQNDKRIMVDTGNGNVQEYTALTVNGEIFLLADDIASIGGYVCNIGDYIGFSKEQRSSFFQFDIDFDGSVHIKKNTYQLEIKKENSQYYLPLEKMLYLMHTTWCVEDGILYVNTLPYSIFDFLEDFYEELCSNLTTDADLLMNGESELLRSIRSSLAKMIREFDSNFYIPFWGVNEQIEEDYEDILIKLTETKEPYVGEIPVAMIEGELQGTLFEDISQENKRLKFMVDLPSKVDQISSNLTEILEMYNASDSIAYKIVKNIDIETFFDKNRLNALSRELEGVSDGIALLGAACNIADVAERAEAMNDTFLDQIAVLRDFDASKYKGASVRHIKNAAVSLIETKQKSMEAIAEETVEQTIDILGGKAADLTFTGKAVSALQTADAVLSQLSGNYANSMVSAEISYILGQSVNLEFIVLRELENMVQDMNGLNYKYTLQNAKKVRDAALLYLNLNLRDKSYIYYLNSINEENWETSEQAKDIKRKIAQIQAMRTALISTEDSDEQIVLEGFKHIYSDKPGMTREKINEDILYHEKDNTNDIQQNGQWSTPYIDYIESIRSENWSEYRLVYINDDDIPELYILGNSVAQGNRVCTIKNGRIQELDLVGDSGISYIEGENIFCDSGGWMDVYHDYVYQITDGDFILIGKGEYGAEDNANVKIDAQGRPIYQYFWNDRQVTVEEYQQTLREVFPQEQAEAAYDNMVTVEEILQQLKSRN